MKDTESAYIILNKDKTEVCIISPLLNLPMKFLAAA